MASGKLNINQLSSIKKRLVILLQIHELNNIILIIRELVAKKFTTKKPQNQWLLYFQI